MYVSRAIGLVAIYVRIAKGNVIGTASVPQLSVLAKQSAVTCITHKNAQEYTTSK